MTATCTPSVTITARQSVCSANRSSWTALGPSFPLGPLDGLVAPFVPIAVVLVYRQPGPSPGAEIIQVKHLRRALTLLLDYYPHLTGRLHINPSDGSPEIDRLGTGMELLVGQCRDQLAGHIALPNLPAGGNALMAPFDASLEAVCRGPILTIQHTRFACGSVALGVRLLHIVSDADGFFQLMRALAELYRGVRSAELDTSDPTPGIPYLAHPPCIRSYMAELGAEMTTVERLSSLRFKPSLFYIKPSAEAEASSSTTVTPPLAFFPPAVIGRSLRFSSNELKALKAHATHPTESPASWISTFHALSAHLYQQIYRARLQLRIQDPSLNEMSPPDFLTPVNLRSNLGLPPDYFSNALFCPYTALPLVVLANGPLWQIAKALHDVTRASCTTADEVNGSLRWIIAQPDKRKIRHGFRYGSGSLMLSQWNKFDMYAGTVFEVPPVLVSPPFTPISLMDGLGYFLPTAAQGKGDAIDIDVNLALSEPLWNILDQNEDFRRFREAA